MKKLKSLLLTPLISLGMSLSVVAPVLAQTPPVPPPTPSSGNTAKICEGVGLIDSTTNCDPRGSTSTVGRVVKTAINLISIVVGVIAVIMIIIGGVKYIMSSGDSNNINSAKNTILYALIGLVIVAFAQVIVRYVLTKTDSTATPTSSLRVESVQS